MMKKLALVAVALAIAVPAFAKGIDFKKDSNSLKISNSGFQTTTSINAANTGLNQVGGLQVSDNHRKGNDQQGSSLTTGAATIISDTEAQMNSTTVGCGCSKNSGDVSVTNMGMQNTLSLNVANTGLNEVSGNGKVVTGAAVVGSFVGASLNTTVIGDVAP